MLPEHKSLLESAYREYLDRMDRGDFEPTDRLLDYDFAFLEARNWQFFSKDMVACDLRELTNIVNHWLGALRRWQVWNLVIAPRDENAAWALRSEFLEFLAHDCLLRPSSMRDTFTDVATSALHQVRLNAAAGYRDHLAGDPDDPTKKPRRLFRKQKEARLRQLCAVWPTAGAFLDKLQLLDSSTYRNSTLNYRNLVSHTIGPRLGLGHTRTVTRSVVQATRMEQGDDGYSHLIPIPGKLSVSYAIGGTPPLDLQEAWRTNVTQFRVARDCYHHFRALLEHAVAEIPGADAADTKEQTGSQIDGVTQIA